MFQTVENVDVRGGDGGAPRVTGWEGVEAASDAERIEEPLSPPLQKLADALYADGYDGGVVSPLWNELSGGTVRELLWNITGAYIGDVGVEAINEHRRARRGQRSA